MHELAQEGQDAVIHGFEILADLEGVATVIAPVGVAALLAGVVKMRPDERVCTILTGGNWDLADLAAVYKNEPRQREGLNSRLDKCRISAAQLRFR